jgi:hypothetical protein
MNQAVLPKVPSLERTYLCGLCSLNVNKDYNEAEESRVKPTF